MIPIAYFQAFRTPLAARCFWIFFALLFCVFHEASLNGISQFWIAGKFLFIFLCKRKVVVSIIILVDRLNELYLQCSFHLPLYQHWVQAHLKDWQMKSPVLQERTRVKNITHGNYQKYNSVKHKKPVLPSKREILLKWFLLIWVMAKFPFFLPQATLTIPSS